MIKHRAIYLIIFLWVVCSTPFVYAKHLHTEKEYQECWCNAHNGVMEYQLKDYCRVDCLTDTHAIEFDFSKKWAESIGQSLYYAHSTGKKAGIVLIMENPEREQVYLNRVKTMGKKYGIDVWVMKSLDDINSIEKENAQ